jgi:hypothetical protein
MQTLVRKINDWAYSGDTFVKRWRAARMHAMMRLVRLPRRPRVVDLGGTDYMWSIVEHQCEVTIVNLPDSTIKRPDTRRFKYIEADACELQNVFADGEFDLAFSNSVIEHVGPEDRQQAFADEARRVGNAYWVQTPSDKFPIEVHTGVPCYWSLPNFVRRKLHEQWRRNFGIWSEMVEGTRVLSSGRMKELFPDGQIYFERQFGLLKSHASYRPFSHSQLKPEQTCKMQPIQQH